MSLRALQQDFGAWLRCGDEADADRFGPALTPGLRVYQNNYRSQLVGCLEATFPFTRQWIGDAAFSQAAVTHIDAVPPSSWTLDAYGCDFAATLSGLFPDDREIAELASLEWAIGLAFTAPDHGLFDPATVAQLDWDTAEFQLSPSIDLLPSTTNAPAIWSALDAGDMPPPAERREEPATLLVWRQAMVSRFRIIDAAERDALLLAHAGRPFAVLCSRLVEQLGEADGVARAGALLALWMADGLIAHIHAP